MKLVSDYQEWREWAYERADTIEFWDRVLPKMEFLEEEGYLEFPDDMDVSSSYDVRAILSGEARWESREEDEDEALYFAYDLPIDLRKAEDEYIQENFLWWMKLPQQPANIAEDDIKNRFYQ